MTELSPRVRPAELRQILKCSKSHERKLVLSGKLHKLRDGRHFCFYSREEVMRLATQGAMPMPSSNADGSNMCKHAAEEPKAIVDDAPSKKRRGRPRKVTGGVQ